MARAEVLIVTNLYPLPWEPNRATFNKQQFDRLGAHYDLKIIVPVAWPEYFKHRSMIQEVNSDTLKYVCYWYTPKVLYRWFSSFMYASLRLGTLSWLKKKPDLIFASWAYPDGAAAVRWAERLKIPMVMKVHGSDINILADQGARKRIITKTAVLAKKVIAVSQALKQKLVTMGVDEASVSVIYNGVDSHMFYPQASSSKDEYLLYVGNLKIDKGVLDLIAAYNTYRSEGGHLKLRVVGGGVAESKMREQIKQFGLESSVELLGALPHKLTAEHMRSAHALVLPSYHEGVPNVLLEAAACGMPVLSTRVGGIPEVVVEGKTGILANAGDVSALARGMHMLAEPGRWDREKILLHAQRFDWDENIHHLKCVVDKVLAVANTEKDRYRQAYERV